VQAFAYRGGYMAANDIDCTKALGIGLVVTCTLNTPVIDWHGGHDVPSWCRFPIVGEIDNNLRNGVPILPVFTKLYRMISNAILRGTNLFIHCRARAHRAGTCTAAYGMMAYDLSHVCCSQASA